MYFTATNIIRLPKRHAMTPRRYRLLACAIIGLVTLTAAAETIGFMELSSSRATENEVRAENRDFRLLLQSLVDAETGIRAFLITQGQQYLEPYHSGMRSLDLVPKERLMTLDALSAEGGQPGEPPFTEIMKRLKQLWLLEISQPSAAGATGDAPAKALADGKALMDRIRADVSRVTMLRDAQIARLDSRIGVESTTNLILILTGAIMAIGAVVYAIDRSIRDAVRMERAVENGAEASRRTRLLSGMAEMLQSAVDRDDANEVLRASAMRLIPGISGSLYIFNNSRDRLDLSTSWSHQDQTGEGFVCPDHIAPSSCWALKRGKSHVNTVCRGALRCAHCAPGITSLEIPMSARGELHGLLQLTTEGSDAGDRLDEVLQVAGALADAMSLALSSIALREQLHNQALRDPLTGLYNRRFMEEMLSRSSEDSERKRLPVSVVMIDLDHFKLLNDHHGHPGGDAVLRHVSNTILSLVRRNDVVCRYGGEELMILMPDCELAAAEAKAEQLRAAIAALSADGSVPPVTASFGVASRPETTLRTVDLLAHADAALYQAKQQGRNLVVSAPLRPNVPTLVIAKTEVALNRP